MAPDGYRRRSIFIDVGKGSYLDPLAEQEYVNWLLREYGSIG
jgi:hypothetical protein